MSKQPSNLIGIGNGKRVKPGAKVWVWADTNQRAAKGELICEGGFWYALVPSKKYPNRFSPHYSYRTRDEAILAEIAENNRLISNLKNNSAALRKLLGKKAGKR